MHVIVHAIRVIVLPVHNQFDRHVATVKQLRHRLGSLGIKSDTVKELKQYDSCICLDNDVHVRVNGKLRKIPLKLLTRLGEWIGKIKSCLSDEDCKLYDGIIARDKELCGVMGSYAQSYRNAQAKQTSQEHIPA